MQIEDFTDQVEENSDNASDGFVDDTEITDTTEFINTFDTEDDGYTDVDSSTPIEFKYENDTLYFHLKDGATEAKNAELF